jgi:hypothetical protein
VNGSQKFLERQIRTEAATLFGLTADNHQLTRLARKESTAEGNHRSDSTRPRTKAAWAAKSWASTNGLKKNTGKLRLVVRLLNGLNENWEKKVPCAEMNRGLVEKNSKGSQTHRTERAE